LNLCMIKRDLFSLNAGFSESNFPHLFGNIDFYLRLRERGLENVYTSYCTTDLQTSARRLDQGAAEAELTMERDRFRKTWHHVLKNGDPFYNLGLLEDNNRDITEFLAWYAGSGSA
jgi:hypothetical protein